MTGRPSSCSAAPSRRERRCRTGLTRCIGEKNGPGLFRFLRLAEDRPTMRSAENAPRKQALGILEVLASKPESNIETPRSDSNERKSGSEWILGCSGTSENP